MDRDGEPWFVLADVCRVLEHSNPSHAASRLKEREKGIILGDTPGGTQKMVIINKPGLYRLLMRSDKPVAERFQDWLIYEVLPAIEKTGGYMVASPEESPEELALRALTVLQATVERSARKTPSVLPTLSAALVFVKEGHVFASSRDVARFFEKRHDHVLRDIDALISNAPELAPNFGEMVYEVEIGSGAKRKFPAFAMDRVGFTLLAMGFTGARALHWKKQYIKAFNAMEAELRSRPQQPVSQPSFQIPQTLHEALRLAADQALKVHEQKLVIAQQEAELKVKRVDSATLKEFTTADNAISFRDTAPHI